MIDILHWNVRGINHPNKQKEVKRLIYDNRIELACLVETKATEDVLSSFGKMLWNGAKVITNQQYGDKCRVCLVWNPLNLDVQTIKISDQAIYCCVEVRRKKFICTAIYASNVLPERESLWEEIISFAKTVDKPWVLLGDFNNVLTRGERRGGVPVSLNEVQGFQNCVETCEVIDLKQYGYQFTWSNRQIGDSRIVSKIDRIMGNED